MLRFKDEVNELVDTLFFRLEIISYCFRKDIKTFKANSDVFQPVETF